MGDPCPYCTQDGPAGCPIHVRRTGCLYALAVAAVAVVCLIALTITAIAA